MILVNQTCRHAAATTTKYQIYCNYTHFTSFEIDRGQFEGNDNLIMPRQNEKIIINHLGRSYNQL